MILLSWSIADTRTSQVDWLEEKKPHHLKNFFFSDFEVIESFWTVCIACRAITVPVFWSVSLRDRVRVLSKRSRDTIKWTPEEKDQGVPLPRLYGPEGQVWGPPQLDYWQNQGEHFFISLFLYLKAGKAEVKASGFLMLPDSITQYHFLYPSKYIFDKKKNIRSWFCFIL